MSSCLRGGRRLFDRLAVMLLDPPLFDLEPDRRIGRDALDPDLTAVFLSEGVDLLTAVLVEQAAVGDPADAQPRVARHGDRQRHPELLGAARLIERQAVEED